jgi:hypothetical protein
VLTLASIINNKKTALQFQWLIISEKEFPTSQKVRQWVRLSLIHFSSHSKTQKIGLGHALLVAESRDTNAQAKLGNHI